MTLYDLLAAPWRAWRNYRLERLRLVLEAQSAPFRAVTSIVEQVMHTQQEQTKVLQEWMAMFKVSEVPTSTVIRDEDEAREEAARKGLLPPINQMSPEQQLQWLHSSIDDDLA